MKLIQGRVHDWCWGVILICAAATGIGALLSLGQLIYRYHAIGYVLLAMLALLFVPYWVGRVADKLV